MDKFYIELYPKADLEREWAKAKHDPGAMPCMRCGDPMRKALAENALSRALNAYILRSNRIDQCAERVEAIAHDIRVLSGCSLNFLLDGKGLSHSTGSIPPSLDHSCEIAVFRMIPCLRPKSLTYSKAAFLCACGAVGRSVGDGLRVSIFV